jgi:hypothetical protein
MIHRITGTHVFVNGFGAALWLDVDSKSPEQQRVAVQNKVTEALSRLGLSGVCTLSHRQIYTQWVFILDAPVDLLRRRWHNVDYSKKG